MRTAEPGQLSPTGRKYRPNRLKVPLPAIGVPNVIGYNRLYPADNYAFATMIDNFQDGEIPGKVQFGSGWCLDPWLLQ